MGPGEILAFFVFVAFFRGAATERNRQLRREERSSENSTATANYLRRGTVGRRRLRCGWLYSGEAAEVGGNHLLGCPPPAEGSSQESAVTTGATQDNIGLISLLIEK